MRKDNELISTEQEMIAIDDLETLAELAEKRVEAIQRMTRAALAITAKEDWVNIGDTPCLRSSGVHKIAEIFGISWDGLDIQEESREDEKGKWILFTVTGRFHIGKRTITALGTASTRTKFFGIREGRPVPLAEVDIESVKKTAYTNCIANGVKMLTGLKRVTWEDIKKVVTEKKDMPAVSFGKSKSPPMETQGKSPHTPKGSGSPSRLPHT